MLPPSWHAPEVLPFARNAFFSVDTVALRLKTTVHGRRFGASLASWGAGGSEAQDGAARRKAVPSRRAQQLIARVDKPIA